MASNKAQKIKEQAIKLFSKGKWDKALEAYSKLTKIEPQDPKNFQKVAELQLKLDMKQPAIETYKKACDQFMARGFLIQAIAICKIVIQLAPEEKDMEERLAELYAKRGIPGAPPPGKGPAVPIKPKIAPSTPRQQPAAARPSPPSKPSAAKPAPTKPKPAPKAPPPDEEAIALEPPEEEAGEMLLEGTSYEAPEDKPKSRPKPSPAPKPEATKSKGPMIELDESEFEGAIPLDDGEEEETEEPEERMELPDDESEAGGIELDASADEVGMEITDSGGASVDMELDEGVDEESGIEIDIGGDGEEPSLVTDDEEPAGGEGQQVWDISEGVDIDVDDGGMEIDIGDDGEEEETPAEAPVYDLSAEMESGGEAEESFIDEWDDIEDATEQAVDSVFETDDAVEEVEEGESPIDIEDLEDVTFFPEIPMFSDLGQEEFREVVRKLRSSSHSKGDVIVREGDKGDSIMIVGSGSVEVFKETEEGNKVMLAVLKEGEFFGEFGYFAGSTRQASVLAAEDTDILEITREDMESVVSSYPGVEAVLEKFYIQRVVENILATSYLFAGFDAKQRGEIAAKFKLEEFREGDDIIVEGDEGAKMYLIRSGTVEVHTKNPMGDKILLADLGPGDFFGEISLVMNKPRTATVSAISPVVELMALNKDDLDELIDNYPVIGEKLNQAVEARTEDTINKVSILDLDDMDLDLEIGSLL